MASRSARLAVYLALSALLAGCGGGGSTTDAAPTFEPSTATPSGASAPTHSARWAVIDPDAPGELRPGRYALPAIGRRKAMLGVVDLPDGYQSWGPFVFADKPDEPDDPLALGLWAVTGIHRDAFHIFEDRVEQTVGRGIEVPAPVLDRSRFARADVER